MNKLCYRIIFNKVRGMLMVVGETANSNGKGVGEGGPASRQEPAGSTMPVLLEVTAAIALAFGAWTTLPAAQAQVVADPGAPGGQRPTVLKTANDVIQVNIQSASAAGVSRNTYSQFDVPQGGVILNNSRVDTQTQIGGWVQGNPWLANGSARVILNEVNSSNPSRLQGYIEVAGQRAEVIVANPAGISVNGGGFINASRATLTTGSVRMGDDGRIGGFTVARGHVDIGSGGLDASTTDYASVIARSVALNGAIWAKQLNVVYGSGDVDAASDASSAAAGEGAAPSYGIDVSQLGGMYANKIFLVGSEVGVGVRNAGEIGAAAGELVVTADGRLENSGRISGKDAVRITARGLENGGQLSGDAGITVAAGTLRNSGLIQSAAGATLSLAGDADNSGGTIQAQRIELTSASGTIVNRGGKIEQTGTTGLDMTAPRLLNAAGGQVGSARPAPVASGSDGATTDAPIADTSDTATPSVPAAGTGSPAQDSPAVAPAPAPLPNGLLRAAQAIDNSGGQITAGGEIGLQVGNIDNSGGKLYLRELSFNGSAFTNRGGTLDVAQRFHAATPVFDNSGGKLLVGGTFVGVLGQFSNVGGELQANSLQVEAGMDLDNTGGVLRQTGSGGATFVVGNTFDNERGTIDSAGALALTAGAFTGSAGTLNSQGDFVLDSGAVRAYGTQWNVAGSATMRTGAFDHSGSIHAAQDLVLRTGTATTNGTLSSGANLIVDGSASFANAGGSIAARGNVTLSAAAGLDNSGTIESGGTLAIEQGAGELRNSGSILSGGAASIAAAGAIDNARGQIATAAGSGAGLRIVTDTLGNRGGAILSDGAMDIAAATAADNAGGQIATAAGSGANLRLDTGSLGNQGGTIVADGAATIAASAALDNDGGTIQARRTLQLDVGTTLDNKGGIVEALDPGASLSVAAGDINSENGRIVNVGSGLTRVTARSALTSSGTIAGNGDVVLAAQVLENGTGGSVSAAGTLDLAVASRLANRGTIGANGRLTLDQAGATLENTGAIEAQGAVTLNAAAIANDGGRIASNADLALRAGTLGNNGGTIAATGTAGSMLIEAGSIDSLAGRIENAGSGALDISASSRFVNSGLVSTRGALGLAASVLENRSGGAISAGTGMRLNAGQQLSNAGTIGSDAALDLQAGGAQVANSGQIVANGATTIAAGSFDNSGGTLATAGGSGADLQLAAGSLANRGGTILADHDAGIAIDGAVDNRNGKIQAGNALQLSAGGTLDNTGGVIEGAGASAAMKVAAASIDNTDGRIVNAGSGDTRVLGGASLLNSGTISGSGRLVLGADTLQNNTGGTLSSGDAMELAAAQRFANLGGGVSSAGTLSFNQAGASFANSGTIVSGGRADIVANTIDNGGGLLATLKSSGADISLRSAGLSNRTGRILADGDANLALTGAFQNAGGTLQAGQDLSVTAAGSVDNDAGTIEALGASASLLLDAQALANGTGRISNVGSGDTVVTSQGAITSHGLIAGNGKLTLNAASLVNGSSGAIGAATSLDLNVRQQLDNAGKITSGTRLTFNGAGATFNNSGQVASTGTTVITAAVINNNGGQISTVKGAGGDIALTGALSNRSGRILADGNATLVSTGGVDNTSGTLQAGKDLWLSASGGLSNNAGVIETLGGSSALTAQAAWIDNGNGRIANVGNRDTRLSGSSIASSGSIGGNGNLVFNSQTLNNAGGSISAGGNLDLAVTSQLENRGKVDSAGTLTFNQAGANFINSGQVSAGGNALITANLINNDWGRIGAVGDLTLTSQVLSNEGGSIAAGRDLRVTTHQMWGSGEYYGGRDLFVSMSGDYTQAGPQRFRSQRDLGFSITGNFTNFATFEAVRKLDLSANYVTNAAGATIRAEDVKITAANGMNNAGDINGEGTLDISTSGNVDNSSGIVGGYVRLSAANLNNTGASALVGGTDGMDLRASGQITNRGGATLYSAGYLNATAGALNNYSSTVEAAGNLGITAETINNVRENIVLVQNQTLDETRHMVLPSWYSHGGNRNYYDPASANYHPYETYFVNPADIIEDSTFITPDGYTIGRVVFRTHANDSAFFAAGSGAYGKYGHRERIQTTEGTRTLYYHTRDVNLANPDQGGAMENGNPLFGSTTMEWDNPPVVFSSQYGSCSTECVRFVTEPAYDDPVNTIARYHIRELAPDWKKLEVWRDAHHTVVEDSLAPGAGAAAQIRSGGNMHLTVNQQLNNQYGEIVAGGYLGIDGSGTRTNQAATLYRHHSFDGKWRTEDGSMANYTMPTISEVTGSVGGVIEGYLGVSITGRSFSNVDVTAGTVGIVRNSVNVLGSGTTGAASGASGAAASGTGNAAGLKGIVGSAFGNATVAATAGAGTGKVGTVGGLAGALAAVRTAGAVKAIPDGAAGASTGSAPATAQPAAMKITPSGLFTKNPDPNAKYLLETRPQFANLENWTSSDYLFQQLGNDPALTQKRLGDGFYEQRMVREQLAQLTGRPPVGGASDDSRYLQLLNDAVSFAKEYGLRPGVALSADQVSRLTSDIVWMEPQQVSLPDGSVETVLVPKVYLAHLDKDAVKPTRALVTGAGVLIDTEEDIVNRGGVIDGGAGRTLLLAGQDIVNQGGSIKGSDVLLAAGRDVRNESLSATQTYADRRSSGSYTSMSNQASISAAGALQVQAGRDFSDVAGKIDAGSAAIGAARDISFGALATGSTYQHAIGEYKQNDSTVTHAVSQLATSGDLTLAAGRDLTLSGVQASIGGNGLLLAGRALNVGAVTDEVKTDQHNDPGSKTYDKRVQENQTVVGSSIGATGDLKLRAGLTETASMTLSASGLGAGGGLSLGASGDVNIEGAQEKHLLDFASHRESGNAFKKSSSTTSDYLASTTAVGSSVQGDTINIVAGKDINATGAVILASGNVNLVAEKDVNIAAAVDTSTETHYAQTKKSGFSGGFSSGVASAGYGKSSATSQDAFTDVTQVGTFIASIDGNVRVQAGGALSVIASDLAAGKDLTLIGGTVDLSAAQNTSSQNSSQQSKSSGFSVGVTYNPAAAYKSSYNASMANSSGASTVGKEIERGLAFGQAMYAALTPVVVQAGSRSATATQDHAASEAKVSTLAAGGKLNILATASSITSQGTSMSAEGDATLVARDNIVLAVAHNLESQGQDAKAHGVSLDTRTIAEEVGQMLGATTSAIQADPIGVAVGAVVGIKDSVKDVLDDPAGAAADKAGEIVSGIKTLRDGVIASVDETTKNELNSLYGQDVSDATLLATAAQGAGVVSNVADLTGYGKAIKAVGEGVVDAIPKAVARSEAQTADLIPETVVPAIHADADRPGGEATAHEPSANPTAEKSGTGIDSASTSDVPETSRRVPVIDVTDEFILKKSKNGSVTLQYGNPEGLHGLIVNVDKNSVLGFDIRAPKGGSSLSDASGTDMFLGAMQRLEQEGVQVNVVRGTWIEGTDSVNAAQYQENLSKGMTPQQAAANTWTGRIAASQGFKKVGVPQAGYGTTTVHFER